MNKKTILISAILISNIFSGTGAIAADPHAYPVPYVARQDTANQGIRFIQLPNFGTILITTIQGDKIQELSISPGGVRTWDLKNFSGESVETGVYFYYIQGEGVEEKGKLVIIR